MLTPQHRLIGKGKLDETVGRVKRYNEVISGEYGYKGANEALDTDSYGSCNKIFPGMMHMCAPQMAKQHPTMVADVRKYLPKRLNTEKGDIRNMMIDMMISLDSMSADLDDIRKGMCFVQQCQGMGMSNYSHKVEKEVRFNTPFHTCAAACGPSIRDTVFETQSPLGPPCRMACTQHYRSNPIAGV